MTSRFTVQTDWGTLSAAYDCPVSAWFSPLLEEVTWAYATTMARPRRVKLNRFSADVAELVKTFYAVNKIPASFNGRPKYSARTNRRIKTTSRRGTILFSAGIDTTYMLVDLLQKIKKSHRARLQCVYVTDINRALSKAEAWAVGAICERLGVRYHIVEVINALSVRQEEQGRLNIGLREQMLLTLALPYILDFKTTDVFFGIHGEYEGLWPPLYTDHKSAFDIFLRRLAAAGVFFDVQNHLNLDVDYVEMIRYLVSTHPDLFALTCACVVAPVYRELLRKEQRAKFPHLPLVGCCVCPKCLAISGVLYLDDPRAAKAPRRERAAFERYLLKRYAAYYSDDRTLATIKELLAAKKAASKKRA